MDDRQFRALLAEATATRMPRRELLRRAAAMGFSAPAIAALAVGTAPVVSHAQDTSNPFGVDGSQPLDILMWDVGWGDEYALNAIEIYKRQFPDVEIIYQGVQQMPEVAQPRFAGGEPPDVIEATQLDIPTLVAEGEVSDLSDLLAAPAYDTPGKTLAETLLPESQVSVTFDGVPYAVNFTYGLQGLWYNAALFEQNGWAYPKTWDEMLALNDQIKAAGVAPWAYQGQYPSYMAAVLWELVWKAGGMEVILAIDNLEEDAWRHESVLAAAQALAGLNERGDFMPGTEGLTHTESQAEWIQGRAAFIPCGTWLENESGDLAPEGFRMTFGPVPPLTADGAVPFEGVSTFVGQPFIVPSKGKNTAGGKEFIRVLCSVENANYFCDYTHSLTTIIGAGEGMDLGPAFNSARDALNAAGANVFSGMRFESWYAPLSDEHEVQLGSLLTGRISPEEYVDRMQQAADDVAADDFIPKFRRES